jgi:mgtE-like transporter
VADRLGAPARLARRAARLFGYWRSERRTLRQGIAALALSTCAGFVAGLVLGSITGTLEALPGFLVLIPAAVGMRGNIMGAIAARLGTGVVTGLFEPTLRRGSVLADNVEIGLVSALLSSLYLAAIAKPVAAAFGEHTVSFWDLVTISVVGGVLASVVILVVTIALAVLSFRRGWDLDAVGTPIITALGDMVTLPALFAASLIARHESATTITAVGCLVLGAIALLRVAGWSSRAVRRILLEMAGVLALAPLLDILAGALLEAQRPGLERVAGLLILIPPFVSQAGALGGILSSRLSSKLQLGVITPRGRPEIPAIVDGSIVVLLGVTIFTVIGAVAWGLAAATGQPHPAGGTMVGGALVAGVLVLPITLACGYYLAVLIARFGLDPDNHGVPIITSVMDLAGVAAILLVMRTSGVLA